MKITTEMIETAALSIAQTQIRLANSDSNEDMLQAVSRSVLTSWLEIMLTTSTNDYVSERIRELIEQEEL